MGLFSKIPGRMSVFGASAAVLSMALSQAAWAEPREFYIPAEDAVEAIPEFARQAGVQIVAPAGELRGVQTPTVQGLMEPREALDRLLEGTGLEVASDDGRVITLRNARDESASPTQLGDASRAGPREAAVEEEIVVTGTRIRGVADVAAPSISLTREDISRSTAATLQDVFESLPQNFTEISYDSQFAVSGGSALAQANVEKAAGVDLRGLGAQSTLTLVNGVRRAGSIAGRVVDVSAIPLSAIERVEIVTGGRSAIYGSDAVAGVVNLVTRRDFQGVEGEASYGFAEHGGERAQLSAISGVQADRGGFVGSYDYTREWAFDLADTGLLRLVAPSGTILRRQEIQPDLWRHSGLLSGRYSLTDKIDLYADAMHSHKLFKIESQDLRPGAATESVFFTRDTNEQYSFSAGAEVRLGSDWRLNFSGGASIANDEQRSQVHLDLGFFQTDISNVADSRAELTTFAAVADGPLFSIGSVTPRIAFGAEAREESVSTFSLFGGGTDDNRSVRSVFAEILIPFAREGDATRGSRLDISLAGRYDDYSDFGGTFNPQAGLVWRPIDGLLFRAAYAEAFRAPAVLEAGNIVDTAIRELSDPLASDGNSPVLHWSGGNRTLDPEEATTWSAGFDFSPPDARWLRLALSYFDVAYTDRIDVPAAGADVLLALVRESRFPGLIVRNPTSAQVAAALGSDSDGFTENTTTTPWDPATQDLLGAFPDLVIFDNRVDNIATETLRAMDASLALDFDVSGNDLTFQINATYTLEHDRRITAASPDVKRYDEVGKPAGFRARASAGWSRGRLGAFTYVNYVDGYDNPFSIPSSTIDSWTTVDLALRFDSAGADHAPQQDAFTAALSITNLFDEPPPEFVDEITGFRYDPTNASPIGRFIALRLAKSW